MKTKNLAYALTAGAILVSSAHAATISWSVFNIEDDVTQISTNGDPVLARTGADFGTANVVDGSSFTINGVTFTDDTVMDNATHLDTLGNRAGSFSGPNADYRTLLQIADRRGTGNAEFNFTGLAVGNVYEIQIWHADNVSTAQDNGLVLNTGGLIDNPVNGTAGHALLLREHGAEGSYGQYAIGTFTADATTQDFMARAWGGLLSGTGSAQNNTTINGVQLRDLGAIPEPSTVLLGSLGFLALLRRRR